MARRGNKRDWAIFLAERYWPGVDETTVTQAAGRLARLRARDASSPGPAADTLSCTFVPEEEAVLCVVRAESADAVRDLGHSAGLEFDRVIQAVALPLDTG